MRAKKPVSISVLILGGLLSASPVYANSYDQLIRQARAGDHTPALQWLQQQPQLTQSQQLDWVLISSWAEQDQQVVDIYRRHQAFLRHETPAREAYARSLRNLQQWAAAEAEYLSLLSRYPERDDLRHALIMTQADGGNFTAALASSADWVQREPNKAAAQLARAYVFMRQGEHFAALPHYDRARQLAADNAEIRREYLLALQRSGLSALALGFTADLELLTAAEVRSLQADQIAERVMLSTTASRQHAERFHLASSALQQADQLLADWADDPAAEVERNRVRIDRLGALHTRREMPQLITDAEQLLAESITLPDFAQRWYASALLQQRQPAKAADIYRELVANTNPRDDTWISDNTSLFYALSESDQLAAADQSVADFAAEQPAYRYPADNAARIPNEGWIEAQTLSANSHLFNDRVPQAAAAFSGLSDAAPGNVGLRVSRASVYGVRGWPRRAEAELKIAESTAPLSSGVIAAQADNAYNLQEWQAADELTDYLIAQHPEIQASERLQERQAIHHMQELQVNAWRDLANGGDAQGSGGYGAETRLYSSPLATNWRAYTGLGYATGSFEEGRGRLRWQLVGAELRIRDHTLTADISNNNFNYGNQTWLSLTGVHDLDDHWQYGWSLDWNSRAMPLRALRSDISGDSQSAYLRWRAHERREWRVDVARLDYDDNNIQQSWSLSGRERLHTRADHYLDLNLALATTAHTRPAQGPYFAPERDVSLLPSLTVNHVLHRHYDTRWSQSLQAGLGGYHQRDFGAHLIGVISYGQRLQLNPRFSTGFSLSLSSRPYDGQREQGWRLDYDLNWRF